MSFHRASPLLCVLALSWCLGAVAAGRDTPDSLGGLDRLLLENWHMAGTGAGNGGAWRLESPDLRLPRSGAVRFATRISRAFDSGLALHLDLVDATAGQGFALGAPVRPAAGKRDLFLGMNYRGLGGGVGVTADHRPDQPRNWYFSAGWNPGGHSSLSISLGFAPTALATDTGPRALSPFVPRVFRISARKSLGGFDLGLSLSGTEQPSLPGGTPDIQVMGSLYRPFDF